MKRKSLVPPFIMTAADGASPGELRKVKYGKRFVDAAPKGRPCKMTIEGASFEYVNKQWIIKMDRLQNDSNYDTGYLNVTLWFARKGFSGGIVDAVGIATAVHFDEDSGTGLPKGCCYSNVHLIRQHPSYRLPAGIYKPVLTVHEECEDGNAYIVGWQNFEHNVKWDPFTNELTTTDEPTTEGE